MKKILFIAALLLCSCHTPDENKAIEFLKSHAKSPSSFKVLEVNSSDYSRSMQCDTTYEANLHDGNYSVYSVYDGVKYDGFNVILKTADYVPATWVNVTYEAKNAFGVSLKGYESVIVSKGRAMSFEDFFHYNRKIDTIQVETFKKKQKYKFEDFVEKIADENAKSYFKEKGKIKLY